MASLPPTRVVAACNHRIAGCPDIARQTAADSARATAAAERSAEAARDAAIVAQSQINPEFRGRIIPAVDQDDEGERIAHKVCLHIKSIGDAVVVREVRILRAFGPGDRLSKSDKPTLVDEVMEPFDGESVMPKRLHLNETLLVTHPAMNDGDHSLERFILSIGYTFSEDGKTGATPRLVVSPNRSGDRDGTPRRGRSGAGRCR